MTFSSRNAGRYGRDWAQDYDALYADRDDLGAVIGFMDSAVETRSILELGVGTGRLAIPLAGAGYRVHGIDASPEMLEILAHKADASSVSWSLGDMADFSHPEQFGAVLCVFSTLFLLPDQQAQLDFLRACARHLLPRGVVIIEGFVLDPQRWNNGHSVDVRRWADDRVDLTCGRLDRAQQTIESVRLEIVDGAPRVHRNRLRYVLPAELDLMAARAGLQLVFRVENFHMAAFNSSSTNQVSVYRLKNMSSK